jgi:hypothetical protein
VGLSLRARLLAVGVAGVALALALGSVVLYAVLTVTLNRTVDDDAFATAQAIAAMVEADTVPDPLPVSGSQLVQVVDGSSAVVSASAIADRLTPLLRPPELARLAAQLGRETASSCRIRRLACSADQTEVPPQ